MDVERQWVEDLAVVERALKAFASLKALAEDALRPLALEGLTHESWRVRRSCCGLLDDVTLTDETTAALRRCLHDEHPKVRRAALHTLTCEQCKPDGCALDLRPILEVMAGDPDRTVRMTVANSVRGRDEEWAVALCRQFATGDRSAEVRAIGERAIASAERKREATARLATLPGELRAKVERHRGKWVAVADGHVVAADRSHGSVRRAVRGKRVTGADLYCVP